MNTVSFSYIIVKSCREKCKRLLDYCMIFNVLLKLGLCTNNIVISGEHFAFGLLDTHGYIGNIVILKIIISGFCPIHFTVHNFCRHIEYSSLYRESLYRGSLYRGSTVL